MVDATLARLGGALLYLSVLLPGCARDHTPDHGAEPASGGTGGQRATGGAEAAGSDGSGGVVNGGAGGAALTGSGGARNSAGAGGEVISGGSEASGGATGGANAGGAGAGGAYAGGANAGGAPVGTNCVDRVAGLQVRAGWDPLGYAPYSLYGCQLAYITPQGDLSLRDLETGEERELEVRDLSPRRPTVSAELVAWEATIDGRASVRVFRAGRGVTLTGEFDHAGEPRAAADALVFTAWAGQSPNSDSDVLLYGPATGALTTALGGPGQQRFADVSADYVAASDFSEDPNGYFDETNSVADVAVYARKTGAVTQRARPFKQAFPMLGEDGTLAYLEWGAVHPEPKFGAFALQLGNVSSPPEQDILVRAITTDPSYVRPSMQGRVIDFIDGSTGPARLYRVDTAAPSELLATELNVMTPLGPVAAPNVTLFGARVGSDVELRVVPRDVSTPSP